MNRQRWACQCFDRLANATQSYVAAIHHKPPVDAICLTYARQRLYFLRMFGRIMALKICKYMHMLFVSGATYGYCIDGTPHDRRIGVR